MATTQAVANNIFEHSGLRAKGGRRACGEGRTAGGVYIECGLFLGGTPLEQYLHDPPSIINPAQYGCNRRGVTLINRQGVYHIVDWVGEEHYPHAADFIEEARVMGVSRKIARNTDFSKITRSSMLFLIHPKGSRYNAQDVSAAATFACPNLKHRPGESCCGLHWTVPGDENDQRSLADGTTYSVTPLPPDAPQPDYAPAVFMAVPITAITQIKDHDGSHNETTWKSVLKSGVTPTLADY